MLDATTHKKLVGILGIVNSITGFMGLQATLHNPMFLPTAKLPLNQFGDYSIDLLGLCSCSCAVAGNDLIRPAAGVSKVRVVDVVLLRLYSSHKKALMGRNDFP